MNSPVDPEPRAAPVGPALLGLLADRRLWTGGLAWAVALFVAANVVVTAALARLEKRHADNLLLEESSRRGGGPPRFDVTAGREVMRHWSFIPDARVQPLIVLNGMSQMYAINDSRPGDQTISEHLDDALAPRGVRVFGLAAPNLSPEESLLYLAATASRPETRPALFVYGVCFDKMRNVGIRSELTPLLRMPDVAQLLTRSCERHAAALPLACATVRDSVAKLDATEDAGEPSVEQRVRDQVGRVVPVVAARRTLNASLQASAFELRNWIFRIKPTDKRTVIPGRYRLNQELMQLAVEVAAERDVRLAWYVIPLNPLADNPYDAAQYAGFKSWVGELARERGVAFANLEGAVPSTEWGEFMGGPDFKHFRGSGHALTAQALLREFDLLALAHGSPPRGAP